MITDSCLTEQLMRRLSHSRMRTRTGYSEGPMRSFPRVRVESSSEGDIYVVRWILRDGSQLVVELCWSAPPNNQTGSSAVVQGEEVR